MFSKSCEYGIKAVLYIATQSLKGDRTKIGDVAKYTGVPEAFTGKLLSTLSKHGIVNSYTGPNGGFEVAHDEMKSRTVADIVSAIDGDAAFYGCVLGLSECNEEHPCPLHHSFSEIRNQLRDTLQGTTIFELATDIKKGDSLLAR